MLPISITYCLVPCLIACVTSAPRRVFPLGKGKGENKKKSKLEALHGLLSKQNVEHVCTQDFTPTHNFPSNVANGSCRRAWRKARLRKVGKTRGKQGKRQKKNSILGKPCKFSAVKSKPILFYLMFDQVENPLAFPFKALPQGYCKANKNRE